MSNSTVGIKINNSTAIAKIYPVIKKYIEMSILDLKKKIDNHDYIIQGEYTDRFIIKSIISCYYDLKNANIIAELYELDDELSTIEFFESLNNTYDEISDEIDNDETI